MEKRYNGAEMAIPQNEQVFFEEINKATAQRRKEWEAQVEEARQGYAQQHRMEQPVFVKRSGLIPRATMERTVGTVARLLLGVVFIGAAGRGFCTAEFAFTGAALCGIWALNRWRRG